ncbi:G protein-coupled receptor kinase type 2, partial [Penaeus vannamei]
MNEVLFAPESPPCLPSSFLPRETDGFGEWPAPLPESIASVSRAGFRADRRPGTSWFKGRRCGIDRVRSVMHKHLEKMGEVNFDKIFNQKLGYLLYKDFCKTVCDDPVPQLEFYEQ